MPPRRLTQPVHVSPLPPYEPPFIPLSASQLQSLSTLTDGPPPPLIKTLSEAVITLGHAGGDLGELVPDDHSPEHIPQQTILDNLEAMARSLVDANRRVTDLQSVLTEVVAAARDHGREVRRRQRDGEEDEFDAARVAHEGEGVFGRFKDGVDAKRGEYERLSMRARYADVAEYVQFRKMVWNAQHGEAQMPKPSTWFVHLDDNRRRSQAIAAGHESDDSDLEIAQERQSYNCPLTLRTFVEPVTSTVCPHSFEKAAIEEFIMSARGNVSCPVPGCSQMLTLATVRADPVLERKVKRAAQRAVSQEEESEDEDEMDVDGTQVEVKNEKGRKRRRARVLDLESEEEQVM